MPLHSLVIFIFYTANIKLNFNLILYLFTDYLFTKYYNNIIIII